MDLTQPVDADHSGRLRPRPDRAARLRASLYPRKRPDTPFWTTPRPTGLDDTDAAAPYVRRQPLGRARRQHAPDHPCLRHQVTEDRRNSLKLTQPPPCPFKARRATLTVRP